MAEQDGESPEQTEATPSSVGARALGRPEDAIACAWCVLAELVMTARETNHVSMVSCIEQVSATELPAELPRAAVASFWYWPDPYKAYTLEMDLELVLLPPSGEEELVREATVELGDPSHRIVFRLEEMTLQEWGFHELSLRRRLAPSGSWEEVARLPLMVRRASSDEDATS